mmetsp:Transcript_23209/g.60727  ORF Transcript_23209/g.60727 Transcript_23209/m.60727 type:complete len:308 (+) Transcript_23209:295-1218(+)
MADKAGPADDAGVSAARRSSLGDAVLTEPVDWSEVRGLHLPEARVSPLSAPGVSPPSTPPRSRQHRLRLGSIGSSSSSHRGSPISQDFVNPRLRRIRSTNSIEAFSDSELESERDLMETQKLVHGISGLPSPRCVSSTAAATTVPDWSTDYDSASSTSAIDAHTASSFSLYTSGEAMAAAAAASTAIPTRAPVSPGAVVARRRMSQGCRPVSEATHRPNSPLHRCSMTKAERAGKTSGGSARKVPSRPRSKTGGSSLRNNSPTYLQWAAATCGVELPTRLSPSARRIRHSPARSAGSPPAFSGFPDT